MSCISVLLCVQTSSFSVFIYKTLWFQFGITVWTFITVFGFYIFFSWFFFTGRKKKNKSSISLCFFGGGFSSMSLLLLITYFFFNWKWIWDYFILSCTIHIFFFFPSFFLLPCPIFSCASESQPSLRETGDLRAQGEVLFNVPVPPPFIKRRLQVVLVCSLQALHPLA